MPEARVRASTPNPRSQVETIRTTIQEGQALARQLAIGFGVALVPPLLIYYGVSTFSHAPKRSGFYTQAAHDPKMTSEEIAARQEQTKAETASYNAAERVFSLRLLCISAPIGYAAILFGAWRQASGLGVGLMFGGIFAVINGYWWHWGFVEDWLRFMSLLIALAILILTSYRLIPSGKTGQPAAP